MADMPSTEARKVGWMRNARALVAQGAERLPALAEASAPWLAASRRGWMARSFLALVLAPTLIFFLYVALWQSNVYVAETRLTVRGAQEQRAIAPDPAGVIARMSASGPKSTIQDSYIVLNYIRSSAILLDLGGRNYLQERFGAGHIDYFSRLKSDPKLEDMLKYWLRRVSASVDVISGILTVKVEAFARSQATQIAQDIVRLGEALVNDITLRNRRDAVERNEREVSLAAGKLAAARDKVTAFREQNTLIDPGARAQSIAELIGRLTLDKIGIENSLSTLKGVVDEDSPTQRVQRSKLAAIDKQISDLRKSLTDPNDQTAVSAQIGSYERLKLEEQFAQTMYTIAQNSYQRARQELEKQQIYLVVVVPPTLPEQATYPRVLASTLLAFASLFVLWSIGTLVVTSVNDHML